MPPFPRDLPRSPGIFVEKVPHVHPPILAATTAVTAFLGRTCQGPVGQPTMLNGWLDFERTFGGLDADFPLGYSVQDFFANGGRNAVAISLGLARTPLALSDWVVNVAARQGGLYYLDQCPAFNLLCLPPDGDPTVAEFNQLLAAASQLCVDRRAFLVLDVPKSWIRQNQVVANASALSLTSDQARNVALYCPWFTSSDLALPDATRIAPPSGAVAGLFARTDDARGVWKAPAGTDATLAGAIGLASPLAETQMGDLNRAGVNTLHALPGGSPVVWGARTLRGADRFGADDYRYVPVRRLSLFIEQSLSAGLRWTAFESNTPALWSQLRLTAEGFLNQLFRQGAFQGTTSQQAYLVKCDATTTTASDIAMRRVNVLIGFAPLKPAEFMLLRLSFTTA